MDRTKRHVADVRSRNPGIINRLQEVFQVIQKEAVKFGVTAGLCILFKSSAKRYQNAENRA